MSGPLELTIRDGRIGRNPSQVTAEGGPVLEVRQVDRPPSEGDLITLADGTEVKVIGYKEQLSSVSWRMTVFVGDV